MQPTFSQLENLFKEEETRHNACSIHGEETMYVRILVKTQHLIKGPETNVVVVVKPMSMGEDKDAMLLLCPTFVVRSTKSMETLATLLTPAL